LASLQALSSRQEKYRSGLYTREGKPRLRFARTFFFEMNLDPQLASEELIEFWNTWKDFDEYLILQKQELTKNTIEKTTIAVKCSKRGNDVYFWRNRKRFSPLLTQDHTFFDTHGNFKKTNALLVTNTYDVKLASQKEAWNTLGYDFNRYITNLRKKYGKISYVRVWEAFFNGYPHIHTLMVFHDYQFTTFRHNGKWRIREKGEFEKGYHSFVDVEAVRSLRAGISYIVKYMSKSYSNSEVTSEVGLRKNLSDLTLAICWVFRKHSFAISRDLTDLIKHLRFSNRFLIVQMDLFGKEVKDSSEWVYVGIKSLLDLKQEYPKLGFNGSWSVVLPSCPSFA
jgi:hypothetical protein